MTDRLACILLLGASLSSALAQVRPPTIDPTYGLPLPKRGAEAKLPPDAEWIWAKKVSDDQTIYLRKTFQVKSAPHKAVLYVTADNTFVAHINGHKVGSTPIDPSDGNLWQRVQHVDVSSLLKPGTNGIAIQAHNDNGFAGVLARLEIDGKPSILSDKTWKSSDQTPGADWIDVSFDDTGWSPVLDEGRVGTGPWGEGVRAWPTPLDTVPPYLFHLAIPPVKWAYAGDPDRMVWHDAKQRMNVDRPAGFAGSTGWRVILDFGKELTGRVLSESSTPGLTLGTGESTGEVLNKPWTTTSSGATPYTALRFASITIPPQEQSAHLNVHLDHLYYPVSYRGSFDCSDPLLTRVWYTGAYTAHLCMQQDIWDAPKRDRQMWMGDLHVSGEVINNVFGDQFLMEQTITHLREEAQHGAPDSNLPSQHVNGIPGYSYAWIAGMADLYRHIGDRAYLQSQHEALLSMLEYCSEDFDEQNLFANKHGAWVYTDWSPDFGNDSPLSRATTDLFFIKGLREAVFLLNSLGDTPNALKYQSLCGELTRAAQAHLLNASGTFGDRKQENAMAIFAEVATPEETATAFARGIFAPETKDTEPVVSPYYGNYVLQALSLAGHTQDGLDYVRRFWGQMVKDGATTFYETYDPLWEKDNFHAHLQWDEHNNPAAGYHVSLCHGWSAGPTTFLTERVLGVRSTGAGFITCDISPQLGDLAWVSGVVPTPHGDIKLKAESTKSVLTLNVSIPRGVTARITLPATIASVDGKPASGKSVLVGPGTHAVLGS